MARTPDPKELVFSKEVLISLDEPTQEKIFLCYTIMFLCEEEKAQKRHKNILIE